jgi:hypothetical protein
MYARRMYFNAQMAHTYHVTTEIIVISTLAQKEKQENANLIPQ